MNIKRLVLSALVVGTSSYLTGCSIGSSESECPGIEKGVICKGPREVMELTNNRDDLSALAGKSRNRERRNRLSMTAVIQLKLALGEVKYPQSTTLKNQPVAYSKTEIKPVGQLPVMYDKTLKMGAPTSSIGPRPISGVPVNSNVRMTSSYSTASSAVTLSFIRLRKSLNKQAIRFLLEMHHATLHLILISAPARICTLFTMASPLTLLSTLGRSSNTVRKVINKL